MLAALEWPLSIMRRRWSGMAENVDEKVRICIEKTIKKINREVVSRAPRASNALRNAELNVLTGQRSGKVYRKPHSKSYYTASAPGEPPARRTGNLRLSFGPFVETKVAGDKSTVIISGIKSNVNYADILEEGRGMARRPYRERIIEKARPEIERIYSEPFF